MKKAQVNKTALVLQFDQQATTLAEHNAGTPDLALNYRRTHGLQPGNRRNFTAVFISEWQMKRQIRQVENIELTELLSELRANAFQVG